MDEIEARARELNDVWRAGRYQDLAAFFHPGVVMLPPGGQPAVLGVEAMVESYRQFEDLATIHRFDIDRVEVHRFGGTAVCHLWFEVDYEIPDGRFAEAGLEVYVFDLSVSPPVVVWRTQAPSASSS